MVMVTVNQNGTWAGVDCMSHHQAINLAARFSMLAPFCA